MILSTWNSKRNHNHQFNGAPVSRAFLQSATVDHAFLKVLWSCVWSESILSVCWMNWDGTTLVVSVIVIPRVLVFLLNKDWNEYENHIRIEWEVLLIFSPDWYGGWTVFQEFLQKRSVSSGSLHSPRTNLNSTSMQNRILHTCGMQKVVNWDHGQRSLVGYSPWDLNESDATESLTLYF